MRYEPDAIENLPYVCHGCGASDCRLWREWNTFLDHQKLYCCNCAELDQRSICTLDASKVIKALCEPDLSQRDAHMLSIPSDIIGNLAPAVPTADGSGTFWGYSSVPIEGVEWWKCLPLRPESNQPPSAP